MSTIAATVSIVKEKPESSRKQVLVFAEEQYTKAKTKNPFAPLTKERVLSDISLSEKQIDEGKGIDATEAVITLRKKYGFASNVDPRLKV